MVYSEDTNDNIVYSVEPWYIVRILIILLDIVWIHGIYTVNARPSKTGEIVYIS